MDARARRLVAVAVLAVAHAGCASLGGLGALVRVPQFSQADGRDAEIVLRGPSRDFPLGGAAVRIHARVYNPNPFGLTLSTLAGDLFLLFVMTDVSSAMLGQNAFRAVIDRVIEKDG